MALPLLPGNSFNHNISKTKYHKPHHFDYCNKTALDVGEYKTGIGGEPRLGQKYPAPKSAFPTGDGSKLPAWVAYDRQVLAFDCYYQEAVNERREEQYRVHSCKLYFYLEDDSIQIVEVRQKNAGLCQGTIVRRHRITKPSPEDEIYYTVHDLNIGQEIDIYGKVFKLTGCDEFTYNFLTKLGLFIPEFEKIPDDAYVEYRKAMDDEMQPLRPYEKFDTLKKFLDYDKQVLRFYCYWDDTDSLYGDPRELVLHYFLSDDTIELHEVIPPNSGRENVPWFLHREKVPKFMESLKKPGELTNKTLLNVFADGGLYTSRYILDNLKTGAVNVEYYRDTDLSIGANINIYGRNVVICDWDEFTKEYYRTKYGITDVTPINYKKSKYTPHVREDPPYHGFGSEEDSLASCYGLMPKPLKGDFVKFMAYDRCGLESNILRFQLKMDTKHPINKGRNFILSFYLSDDTVQVFEPPVQNSGIIGGKFMERSRAKKPNQPRFSEKLSEYYRAEDIYIGARLEINDYIWLVVGADEYALKFMEARKDQFPLADAERVMNRLRTTIDETRADMVKKFLSAHDPSNTGCVPFCRFHELMLMLDPNLIDHEIISVGRFYSFKYPDEVDPQSLMASVQEQLRKVNYDEFDLIRQCLMQRDQFKKGKLEFSEARNIFLSCHVPIEKDLIDVVLHANRDENGDVIYDDVIRFMNWKLNPVSFSDKRSMIPKYSWKSVPSRDPLDSTDYRQFTIDLLGQYASP